LHSTLSFRILDAAHSFAWFASDALTKLMICKYHDKRRSIAGAMMTTMIAIPVVICRAFSPVLHAVETKGQNKQSEESRGIN
jgi:hypothetical protein